MKENTYHYTYSTAFCERYDLTGEEAAQFIKSEMDSAKKHNRAVILTGKFPERESFFDAFTPDELSHNFTWIHMCAQELLEFDDAPQEGKFYVSTFTSTAKEAGVL